MFCITVSCLSKSKRRERRHAKRYEHDGLQDSDGAASNSQPSLSSWDLERAKSFKQIGSVSISRSQEEDIDTEELSECKDDMAMSGELHTESNAIPTYVPEVKEKICRPFLSKNMNKDLPEPFVTTASTSVSHVPQEVTYDDHANSNFNIPVCDIAKAAINNENDIDVCDHVVNFNKVAKLNTLKQDGEDPVVHSSIDVDHIKTSDKVDLNVKDVETREHKPKNETIAEDDSQLVTETILGEQFDADSKKHTVCNKNKDFVVKSPRECESCVNSHLDEQELVSTALSTEPSTCMIQQPIHDTQDSDDHTSESMVVLSGEIASRVVSPTSSPFLIIDTECSPAMSDDVKEPHVMDQEFFDKSLEESTSITEEKSNEDQEVLKSVSDKPFSASSASLLESQECSGHMDICIGLYRKLLNVNSN